MTAILDLPLYEAEIETRSNADARGSFEFTVDDVPVALTGIAFRLQLRKNLTDRTAALDASSASGELAVAGASNNFLSVSIDDSSMARLPAGEYHFDIRATADGVTVVVLQGIWTHVHGVTRA